MKDILTRTKDELKKNIHWSKKAVVINTFHKTALIFDSKWTLTNTAKELGFSKAYISECVMLANRITPEMTRISRRSALRLVKGDL